MGRFIYDNTQKVDIEDRALTHVQIVMVSKLRRGEPFGFSWKDDRSTGGGRTTVWIHSHANLVFKYSGSKPPAVNRAWIHALDSIANAPSGLYVVPEPSPTRTTEAA